jgi:transcriptional regulator with XRE-family HTH domain
MVMGRKRQENRLMNPLGLALRAYREANNGLTQEQLAALLEEDPRQIRRWENNETWLRDIHQLKRIADRLGIPYERLGITSSIYTPISIEQINETIDRVWMLIDEGRISEARAIADNLLQEASPLLVSQDPVYIDAFARMYHVVAHANALNTRTSEVSQALTYYQQMEYFARLLKNDTQLNISLTYQGDMFRRQGNMVRSIECLEGARDLTPGADVAARGNMMQLLARSYIRTGKVKEFDVAIKSSEALAHEVEQQSKKSTGNQYHLVHVYEEYAKGYDSMKKPQLALDYIDRAEKLGDQKSSQMLLKVARAEILIHSGDLRNGEPLAVEVAIYSREHGHYRRLERIYALKRYLNQQVLKYGKTELALSEALEGPNEY